MERDPGVVQLLVLCALGRCSDWGLFSMLAVSLKLLFIRLLQFFVKYNEISVRNAKVWGHTPSLQIILFLFSVFTEVRFHCHYLVFLSQGDSSCGCQGIPRNGCTAVAPANLVKAIKLQCQQQSSCVSTEFREVLAGRELPALAKAVAAAELSTAVVKLPWVPK